MQLSRVALMALLFLVACSKSKDDKGKDEPDPPPGGNNDPVAITSTSPDYPFWGGQLTITGSGFSDIKTDNVVWYIASSPCFGNEPDTAAWKRAEIVSATSTKIVIKVPYTYRKISYAPGDTSDIPCGADLLANVRVMVKGKDAAIGPKDFKPMGFPWGHSLCDNYAGAGYINDNALFPGDSVYMKLSPDINLWTQGHQSKIRLRINQKSVQIKPRQLNGCATYGFSFMLPNDDFVDFEFADDITYNYGIQFHGNYKPFTFYLDGVANSEITIPFFVSTLPKPVITKVTGDNTISKSGDLNPYWLVEGKNMYYPKGRITSSGVIPQEFTLMGQGIRESFHYQLPLSLMSVGKTYNLHVIDHYDKSKVIGSVTILP